MKFPDTLIRAGLIKIGILLLVNTHLALGDAAKPTPAARSEPLQLESTDGKTIQATPLSATDTTATVKRTDGKIFEIPFTRLTAASAKALKDALAAQVPTETKPTTGEAKENDKEKTAEADRPLPKDKPTKPEDIPEKVTVKMGQKVRFTLTPATGGLAKPVALKDGDPEPDGCFSVDFSSPRENNLTMATVAQSLTKEIRIKCLARNKGSTKWYHTSILPLEKGLPCFESWGNEVEELVFYDFATGE
jgi:hypothetical protein